MKEKRIDYLDMVRGICILYMIAGHIGFQNQYFSRYIHAFHMPLFFIIAGFFYKQKDISISQFFIKNIKKVLLPYFFWAILFVIFDKYTSIGPNYGLKNNLHTIFTYNNQDMPIAGALWFLTSYFFSISIFYTLNKVLKKEYWLGIISFLIFIIGIHLKNTFNIELFWSLNPALVGVGLIYIGFFIKKRNLMPFFYIKNNLILLFTIVIHLISNILTNDVNMRLGDYPLMILFIINVLLSFMVYISISIRVMNIQICRIFNNWIMLNGKESMILLCLNEFIIAFVRKIMFNSYSIYYNFNK